MIKYLLLLQVLFASELCGGQIPPKASYFGSEEYLGMFDKANLTNSAVKMGYMVQLQNHFNQAGLTSLWTQRFLVNDEYYQPGGPVFIMIGSGGLDLYYFMEGALIQYAKRFGAMCFFLEHRYYGNSLPTFDASFENLKYLSSEQALADAARFIYIINQEYNLSKDVKWIAFGGFYSGSLAAWLRLKYPHLVHGAVSSSAPLNPQIYYSDYYRIVAENIAHYNTECASGIQDAFAELDYTLAQNLTRQDQVKQMFNLCQTQNDYEYVFSLNDVSNLNRHLASRLSYAVSGNDPNNSTIGYVCNMMTNQNLGTPLNRLATFARSIQGDYCMIYKYDDDKYMLQDVNWGYYGPASGERQRLYQACTEFGWFTVPDFSSQVFGEAFDIDYFIQLCTDVFGPKYYNGYLTYISALNTKTTYGGTNIDVRNVVFVQESADPWYPLGIQKNMSSNTSAIIINGAGHCADMEAESDDDSPEVKAAREQIVNYIQTWLKE